MSGDKEKSARDQLAERQASLVSALVAGDGAPEGVDAERVRIQAAALRRKRGRSVALAAPSLAAALGADFMRTFDDYATGQPPPGGSAADAQEFARYLMARPEYRRDRQVRRAARGIRRRRRG